MKVHHRRRQHGYSLAELLTIVAIVGVVTMVTIPAFMQLMPQYRIRSASSEVAASLRMLRGKAVSTRSNWKMIIDPTTEQYSFWENIGGTWTQMGENGKPVPAGVIATKALNGADIQGASTFEVVFTRDGSITPTTPVDIVLATDNKWVRYNRYTITVAASGNVTVTGSKV